MINKNATNPAALRSRKALATALVSLLLNHPLKDIKIEDITRTAGLSRQTFYTNFSQKEDILEHALNELFLMFTGSLQSLPETINKCWQSILNSGADTKNFCQYYLTISSLTFSQPIICIFSKMSFPSMQRMYQTHRKNCPIWKIIWPDLPFICSVPGSKTTGMKIPK